MPRKSSRASQMRSMIVQISSRARSWLTASLVKGERDAILLLMRHLGEKRQDDALALSAFAL